MAVRETSKIAYNQIRERDLLSPKRMEIYDWLFKNGPASANEIFKGIMGKTSITQANIHARLNEMREMGVVQEKGTKHCDVTRRVVINYDVTANLPVYPEKKDKPYKVEMTTLIQDLREKMAEINVPYIYRADIEAYLKTYDIKRR